MESNFYLETQTRDTDVHINLHGVFDGASAFELIQNIEAHPDRNIVIETQAVTRTMDYGRHVLKWQLPKRVKRSRLHFSGDHAKKIMPAGCRLLKQKNGKPHICTGNCKNCTCGQAAKDMLADLRN